MKSVNLNFREVCFSYNNDKAKIKAKVTNENYYSPKDQGIRSLSASFLPKELTVIVGPNGSGKSTLGKLASGLYIPDSGSITFDARSLFDIPAKERALFISMMPQNAPIPVMTVYEYVSYGRAPFKRFTKTNVHNDDALINEALEMVGIKHLARQQLHKLSGGQCQLARVALTITQNVPIMIFDEPTTYLDVAYSHHLMTMLKQLAHSSEKTVIVIIHDLDIAIRYADKVAVMNHGKLEALDTPDEVIRQGILNKVFNMKFERVIHQGESLLGAFINN